MSRVNLIQIEQIEIRFEEKSRKKGNQKYFRKTKIREKIRKNPETGRISGKKYYIIFEK